MAVEPWLWPAGLGLLGLIFGSFIATLAIRWPQGRTIARGRSECGGCGVVLRPHELVPVLSYLLQRGQCRGCGARIAPSHLAVELLGLCVGAAAGWAAPGAAGVGGAVFGWILLTLAALDLAAFWLPNLLTGALAVTGLIAAGAGLEPSLSDRLIGGAAGFGMLWLVAEGYRRARGRVGLGGGDPKLFGGIGLWLGWRALPGVLFAACLIGLAAVLILRLRGRALGAGAALPLGVLLAAAAFPAWLLGSLIV
ncbi:prepilin peptidase [Sphingomonas sp. S2-65]|uniref:prepilin peptidase n=1 Tax=Sphingomonas sp. S2-65 TaxID=2903960 RepID=UPI001F1A6ECB|nr:A24 family peptidase [Sphingomonas sp. S2-65]UYY59410.1 prepilin peptidase [Sphingomonas sp. S2-65]